MKKSIWWILSLLIATGMTACGGNDKDEKKDDNKQPSTTIVENTSDLCSDNLDNDNNGLADCQDPGCKDFAFCQEAEEGKENTLAACMDDEDNDGDGAKDCDDTECKAFTICQESEPENTLATCQDGKDNDKDGLIDCNDPECKEFNVCNTTTDPGTEPEEKKTENSPGDCLDGEDNDGDGKIDCDDEGCKVFTFCLAKQTETEDNTENTIEKCTDGEDNDKNGALDCLDPNCRAYEICADLIGVAENTRELCSDDIDNDYNGVKDKDDPNCKLFYAAGGKYGESSVDACKDGNDNDGDGVKDCEDPECQVYDFCLEGYKAEDDQCTEDPFTFKKEGTCDCGQTQVGSECYTNITKPEDFDLMANSSAKFIIKKDIEFGKTDRSPIMGFRGTLDGNNKRITGVFNQTAFKDPSSSVSYCGIFGKMGETSKPVTVKNIDIAITLNCDNKDYADMNLYAGAISGSIIGSASNITGSSKVYAEEPDSIKTATTVTGPIYKRFGGLFGSATSADLSDITLTGNVSAYLQNTKFQLTDSGDYYQYIGGAAGSAKSLTNIQTNNYVTLRRKAYNSYTTYDFIGGVAGSVSGNVHNVSNQGVINFLPLDTNRKSSYLGGIAGRVYGGNVTDSSFIGLIETNVTTAAGNYLEVGGIAGVLDQNTTGSDSDTNTYGIDHCQVNATMKVQTNSHIGGILGYNSINGRYVRNCSSAIELELFNDSDNNSVCYGGIIGSSSNKAKTYIVNNSARTNYIQLNKLNNPGKNISGISGMYGIIVNNFASDKLTCPDNVCDYMPKAIGGEYVYESYWNKDIFGSDSGSSYYSDASAEPYTYNIAGVPLVRNGKTVLGLLRYNSAHDGGVLSANIPANDDDKGGMIYHDWTVENDNDGHQIPIPAGE